MPKVGYLRETIKSSRRIFVGLVSRHSLLLLRYILAIRSSEEAKRRNGTYKVKQKS
jgi:hypothetical protein